MDLSQYYKLLQLPNNSSLVEVKKAYRKLSFIYHPDKYQGNPDTFIEIKDAYEIIIGKRSVPKPTIRQGSYSSQERTSQTTTRQKTNEEKAREFRKKYSEQKKREEAEEQLYYARFIKSKSYKIAKICSCFCLLIAITMGIDQSFYYTKPAPIITFDQLSESDQQKIKEDIYNQTGENYAFNSEEVTFIPDNRIDFRETLIFRKSKKFNLVNEGGNYLWVKEIENGTIWGLILFFTIPLYLLIRKEKSPLLFMCVYITLYFITPLAILTLYFNI